MEVEIRHHTSPVFSSYLSSSFGIYGSTDPRRKLPQEQEAEVGAVSALARCSDDESAAAEPFSPHRCLDPRGEGARRNCGEIYEGMGKSRARKRGNIDNSGKEGRKPRTSTWTRKLGEIPGKMNANEVMSLYNMGFQDVLLVATAILG